MEQELKLTPEMIREIENILKRHRPAEVKTENGKVRVIEITRQLKI